jgi:hypothetical protein
LQYHCFALALLVDIYQLTGWRELREAIEKGVDGILQFILRNGDTLYLGRGQEQVFGYAALLYALAGSKETLGTRAAMPALQRVWARLISYQREDGSFPLVLRAHERGYPLTVDTADAGWLGWYAYNNYFDYLPLLGAYLGQIADLPSVEEGQPKSEHRDSALVVERAYAIIEEKDWQAVIAAPGATNTEGQPSPYMCIHGRSALPCFGGEEYAESTRSLQALSLPYLVLSSGKIVHVADTMRWKLARGHAPNTLLLLGRCRWARFRRLYTWTANEFRTTDILRLEDYSPRIAEVVPLVWAAFDLEQICHGVYSLSPSQSDLTLRVEGVQGWTDVEPGTSPIGLTRVLRESVPLIQGAGREFRRSTRLTWSKSGRLLCTRHCPAAKEG